MDCLLKVTSKAKMKKNLYISTIYQVTRLHNWNSSDWMSKSEMEMSDLIFYTLSIEKKYRKWGNKLQLSAKSSVKNWCFIEI